MFKYKISVDPPCATDMSQAVYEFLDYPVTPLPSFLGKVLGTTIDNGTCNGAAWVLLLWSVHHAIFDAVVHRILLKTDLKSYIRARIKASLWFLVNFTLFFAFAVKIAARYRLDLFNWNSKFLHTYKTPPSDVSVAILVLGVFYLHMTLYQIIKLNHSGSNIRYFLLFLIYTLAYTNRKIEVPLVLSTFIGASEIVTALTRITFSVVKTDRAWLNKSVTGLFVFNHLLWIATYIVIIPLRLVLSPAKRIWYDFKISQAILILVLVVWFVVNLYDSNILKWFSHWLEHGKEDKYNLFRESAVEFALFNARNDPMYFYKLMRAEMKAREEEMISRRKPKNRNVLFQTIKCMLAIKRKRKSQGPNDEDSDSSCEKEYNEDERDETLDVPNTELENENSGDVVQDEECHVEKIVIKVQKPEIDTIVNEEVADLISDQSEERVAS